MKRFIGVVSILALSLSSEFASAQQAGELPTGVRVRVTQAHGDKLVGDLVASSGDSLAVMVDGPASHVRSALSSEVTRVEVSAGRSRARGALIKGAIGFGLGIPAGALLAAATYSKPKPVPCTKQADDQFGLGGAACVLGNAVAATAGSKGAVTAAGGLEGGLLGLLLGTVIGAATGQESWTTITFR